MKAASYPVMSQKTSHEAHILASSCLRLAEMLGGRVGEVFIASGVWLLLTLTEEA